MKKILFVLAAVFISQTLAGAWPWDDYASLNLREAKESQKYGTTNRYFAATNQSTVSTVKVKDPNLIPFGNYKKIDDATFKAKISKDDVQYNKIKDNLRKNKVDDYETISTKTKLSKGSIVVDDVDANELDPLIDLYRDSNKKLRNRIRESQLQ